MCILSHVHTTYIVKPIWKKKVTFEKRSNNESSSVDHRIMWFIISIEYERVKSLSTGFLPNIFMHYIRSQAIYCHCVGQRLGTALQTEWHIIVSNRVSKSQQRDNYYSSQLQLLITVHIKSGEHRAPLVAEAWYAYTWCYIGWGKDGYIDGSIYRVGKGGLYRRLLYAKF